MSVRAWRFKSSSGHQPSPRLRLASRAGKSVWWARQDVARRAKSGNPFILHRSNYRDRVIEMQRRFFLVLVFGALVLSLASCKRPVESLAKTGNPKASDVPEYTATLNPNSVAQSR